MIFFIFLFEILSSGFCNNIPEYWSPDGEIELWCPEECDAQKGLMKERCCACSSKPAWEIFSNVSYQTLVIEILDMQFNTTMLYNTTEFSSDSTYFSFVYTDGSLHKFPENSCEFYIVTIDVTNNMFNEIGDLSCFVNLDTLIMKENLIEYVSNETFVGLKRLRKVDLSF